MEEVPAQAPGADGVDARSATVQVAPDRAWTVELQESWNKQVDGTADPRLSVRPHLGDDDDAPTMIHQRKAKLRAHTLDESGASDFRLVSQLGGGGMGEVFRAVQSSLGRNVAVKRLRTDIEYDEALEQFENEARICAFLDHPNIVPIYELGSDQEAGVFYAMKVVEGVPWIDLLLAREPGKVGRAFEEREGLNPDLREHLEILVEASQAIAFAHSRGFLHRDIKPDNIMVGEYGEVLMVDWGLSVAFRYQDGEVRFRDLDDVHITAGTPMYMAPETAQGLRQVVGPWTDVYSLGAVLYEVIYCTPLYRSDTAMEAIEKASRNKWAPPQDISTELMPYHAVFLPVLQKALATQPYERYRDANEFSEAIRAALRHLDSARLAASGYLKLQAAASATAPDQAYRELNGAIAAFEQAISLWDGNLQARVWLAGAHLQTCDQAIKARDFNLARTQIQAYRDLPNLASLGPESEATAKGLEASLTAAEAKGVRRRRRTRLLQGLAAGLLLGIFAVTAVGYVLVKRARDRTTTERNHLSQLLISTAADGVEADLGALFEPVRSTLFTSAAWARDGRLDTDDPALLVRHFEPLLDTHPQIYLVSRADADGNDFGMMRGEGDVAWRVRMTTPGEPSHWSEFSASGELLREYTETTGYDPLTRPWYKGARSVADGADDASRIHWTDPYTFFTSKEPGITASMAVRSKGGRDFVFGFDLLLSDISEFTSRMPEGRFGKVFVFDGQDQIIGLPRSEAFPTAADRKAAVLTELSELPDPVTVASKAAWEEKGRPDGEPFRLLAEGQFWWAGVRSFPLGEHRVVYIGVVLPESDFLPDEPAE